MKNKETRLIKRLIIFFIISLFLSGVTAIPVEPELAAISKMFSPDSSMYLWMQKVLAAYRNVNDAYPYLLYGYDWLAFAHFVLAILFIGPYKDPIKNIWVIEFGMIACVLIFPLAFIAGHFRHIPIGWQLIDCSFGVFGFIPLKIIHSKIKILTSKQNKSAV